MKKILNNIDYLILLLGIYIFIKYSSLGLLLIALSLFLNIKDFMFKEYKYVSILAINIVVFILFLIMAYQIKFFNTEYKFIQWSQKEEIKLNNNQYKNNLYNNWYHKDSYLTLTSDNKFVWFLNNDNNIEGIFTIENGSEIDNNLYYQDDNYYYYLINMIKMKSFVDGEIKELYEEVESNYNLKLNKNFKEMCLIKEDINTCYKLKENLVN